jgi:hypothetical protein
LYSLYYSSYITEARSPFFQITIQYPNNASADCDWAVGVAKSAPLTPAAGNFGFK